MGNLSYRCTPLRLGNRLLPLFLNGALPGSYAAGIATFLIAFMRYSEAKLSSPWAGGSAVQRNSARACRRRGIGPYLDAEPETDEGYVNLG